MPYQTWLSPVISGEWDLNPRYKDPMITENSGPKKDAEDKKSEIRGFVCYRYTTETRMGSHGRIRTATSPLAVVTVSRPVLRKIKFSKN